MLRPLIQAGAQLALSHRCLQAGPSQSVMFQRTSHPEMRRITALPASGPRLSGGSRVSGSQTQAALATIQCHQGADADMASNPCVPRTSEAGLTHLTAKTIGTVSVASCAANVAGDAALRYSPLPSNGLLRKVGPKLRRLWPALGARIENRIASFCVFWNCHSVATFYFQA